MPRRRLDQSAHLKLHQRERQQIDAQPKEIGDDPTIDRVVDEGRVAALFAAAMRDGHQERRKTNQRPFACGTREAFTAEQEFALDGIVVSRLVVRIVSMRPSTASRSKHRILVSTVARALAECRSRKPIPEEVASEHMLNDFDREVGARAINA